MLSCLEKGSIYTVKTAAVMPEPQVRTELTIPHVPFEEVSVNPEPRFLLESYGNERKKGITRSSSSISSTSATHIPCPRTNQTTATTSIQIPTARENSSSPSRRAASCGSRRSSSRLGKILNSGGSTSGGCADGSSLYEGPELDGPGYVVGVPDLVEGAGSAVYRYVFAVAGFEGGFYGGESVGCCC